VLRVLTLFMTQLLLWTLLAVINHHLTDWQLYLYTGGLFVTFAGLLMGPREGMAAAILSGFIFDAGSSVTFGQNALLHGIGFLLLFKLRSRLAHEETAVQVVVAIIANILLYLVRFVLLFSQLTSFSGMWSRFLWELVFSSVAVGLLVPWTFALQAKALDFATPPGFRRNDED
jgi:rod shape-determining protein MreD